MRVIRGFLLLLLIPAMVALGCGGGRSDADKPPESAGQKDPAPVPEPGQPPERPPMPSLERTSFFLESPTVVHHGAISTRHTCDGEGLSPELRWENVPETAKSFVLMIYDPDAESRNLVHWLLYNLPPDTRALPENVAAASLPAGTKVGKNGVGTVGWTPICPTPGGAHRLVFLLYAVDQMLDLPAGAARADVEKAMKGHFLGQVGIISSYARTAS